MSRSFQIVEHKVEEAQFFLDRLKFRNTDFLRFNIKHAFFYLSAFLSASRSITFCLQASLRDLPGFDEWYEPHQARLKASELARFFLQARNSSEKVGYYPIGGARVHPEDDGSATITLYFGPPEEDLGFIPQVDVVTACASQFREILEVIVDCYKTFGDTIDPERYYTLENMQRRGLTVEALEAELGLENGWADTSGLDIEERVALIRQYASNVAIDWIFGEHLGTDRYGVPKEKAM